ncbi:MAG: VOC family protein [Jannaschia sp.]
MSGFFDLRQSPLWVDHVTLAVRDLDRVAGFYRDVVGLSVLSEDPGRVTLGTASPLVVLEGDPALVPVDRRGAGLFHTAFLMPSRAALGRWLSHAQARGVTLTGGADHSVSEALYLDDPEGNGIEIYHDRRTTDWVWTGDTVKLGNAPLDRDGLLDVGRGDWAGQPPETMVGHVHLQVGDVARAAAFFAEALDLSPTLRMPSAGFFATGGYHHQVAANVWNSAGAGPRPDGMAGLREIAVRTSGHAQAGRLTDPWGTAFRVVPPDAAGTAQAR